MLVAGDDIGKYKILGFLGSGHFGSVYKVSDRALNVERALKILEIVDPNKFVELYEAQIQYRCRHENCVLVNSADVHVIAGKPHVCIDMELLTDGSLEDYVGNNFISAKFATKLVCDLSYGLEHAHTQGVLHKDIKPGNIMISNNIGKLSDFGISQYVGTSGVATGTAYVTHQPPEFFANGEITAQSDVHSLGVTLFRCLNNLCDWDGAINSLKDPDKALQGGTLIQEIGWQPWIPQKLKRIVLKACSADAVKRFKNVREFRQALEKLDWKHDWTRVDDNTWQTRSPPIHEALITGPPNYKFEHLVNGRRRTAETQHFLSKVQALEHLHKFVTETTLQ
jgi:eukaryotic-like serine/threonine-protein kinase